MAKKTVEMGRYGASELLRNPNLQKKAVDYGMKKLTPFVYDTAGTAIDQLSTKIRPNKKYITDRKDLDGSGIDIHKWIGKLPRPKAGWTPGNYNRGTKRLVSVNICSVEGNSADIFVSKVSPGIFAIKVK